MKFRTKRVIALVMAGCLTLVSLPGGLGVRQVRAAEQTETQRDFLAAGQSQVQDQLRGAASEEDTGVVFSKESGTYREAFDLELTCADPAAEIYYTTDGSDPSDPSNEARQVCSEGAIRIADRMGDPNVLSAIDPILYDAVNVKASADGKSFVSTVEKPSDEAVDKCTVIKAAAQYADGSCSAVATNTYFIGDMADHIEGIQESCEAAGMDLSVMSISMDADDLFDSTKGIYVKGDVFDQALEEYLEDEGTIWDAVNTSRNMDANYKQKGRAWERPTHIDYFESDGTETTCKLQQDCGIRIQGNYSRSDYQKSFRLFAREDYGKKNFKYGFWDNALDDQGNVIEKYKKIVLRNGGNCAFTTKFSDSYWQSLIEDIDCDKQSARPCVVYLNGEYWGVYILQDDFCGAYMENKHGVDKDSVVIYKGDAEANQDLGYKLDEGDLPEGETNDNYYFRDLEEFMSTHDDLSNAEDYEAFCELVDPESVLDYFATEVWINNKWDWPGKNWSMWKTTTIDPNNPYADGRWRFLIYDVEFGGISGASDASANTVKESKLLNTGTAERGDSNWDKPNVRCFALLMTNEEFRESFKARLTGFSDTIFEQGHALEVANKFRDMYQPILDQFFRRFPTLWDGEQKTADMVINGNGWDTYGTWINIVSFLQERADYIDTITNWIDKKYSSGTLPTLSPSATPGSTPAPSEAKATATPAPTKVPAETNKSTSAQVKLCDGAVKLVQLDAQGKVLSTKYRVGGITYTLKSNGTFVYSAENKTKLKKKKSVVIPDVVVAGGNKYKVTEIEKGAFKGLKKLKSVTIGENIKRIGKEAFRGCKKLKKITFIGKKLSKIESKAFQGIAKKAKVICPKAKKKKYQKLIKKSGVNLKKTKLAVTKLKQSNPKKAAEQPVPHQSSGNETGVAAPVSANRKAEQTTVAMSSLVKEDGSFQNAPAGAVVTIGSAEELKLLSEYTNAEKKTVDITFRQTADIDGTDVPMKSIGAYVPTQTNDGSGNYYIEYEEVSFMGTYDGNGYQIQNLSVLVEKSSWDEYYLGMFGFVEDAVLLNINMRSIRFIDAETLEPLAKTTEAEVSMAGIVASVRSGSQIEGCNNYADLTAVSGWYVKLGGIAADGGEAEFRDCHNYGNVTTTGVTSYAMAAGITAEAYGNVTGCTNSGEINSDVHAAGIAGQIFYGDIKNCANKGSVTGKYLVGGIASRCFSEGSEISTCNNTGEIRGGTTGGIAGNIFSNCTVVNCVNTGEIQGSLYAGGIAGMVLDASKISVAKNQAKISGNNVAGGIVGYAEIADITNAQNLGDVTAAKAVGGIAGFAVRSYFWNLWNHGNISGTGSVGGIVGNSDQTLYDTEYDDWSSDLDYANTYGNCVHLGTLTEGASMGAVIGYSKLSDHIAYCYYLEGSAVQANGCDATVMAQSVQADVWQQQSFLDELNQNSVAVNAVYALPMEYDEQMVLQWNPQIVIGIQYYGESISKTELDRLGMQFEVKNMTTGEVISLGSQNGNYKFSPTMGTGYSIYQIMPNGTKKLLKDNVSLQEGENIYILNLYLNTISFYTDVTWSYDEENDLTYDVKDPYTVLYYQEPEELSMPADPTKEGYEFGGWYSTPYAIDEELYAKYKEQQIQSFQESYKECQQFWDEMGDFLTDYYDSEEEFIESNLKDEYGCATLDEYVKNFDEYFDKSYKLTELYETDDEDIYVSSNFVYAKWIRKQTQGSSGQTQPSQNTNPASENKPAKQATKIDLSKYQDKAGAYVQKKGLIYKVNRKKKTATIVGVTSKAITKATIVATVKTGGKSYKVKSIAKNAFKGCYQLKTIKAKGKSLKKVKKKALKMLRKK